MLGIPDLPDALLCSRNSWSIPSRGLTSWGLSWGEGERGRGKDEAGDEMAFNG